MQTAKLPPQEPCTLALFYPLCILSIVLVCDVTETFLKMFLEGFTGLITLIEVLSLMIFTVEDSQFPGYKILGRNLGMRLGCYGNGQN